MFASIIFMVDGIQTHSVKEDGDSCHKEESGQQVEELT